jgi:hypothetical protein
MLGIVIGSLSPVIRIARFVMIGLVEVASACTC